MTYRLRIVQRTPPGEDDILPEWPEAGPEMNFATSELAAQAGAAEIDRLAALGHDAAFVILDPDGRWVDHPGTNSLV